MHESCCIDNPAVVVSFSGVKGFLYGGPRPFEALSWYLAQFIWLAETVDGATRGVTWTEMAIDYELATGEDLPPTRRQLPGAAGKLSRAARAGAEADVDEPFRRLELEQTGRRLVCNICTQHSASGWRFMKTHCVGCHDDASSVRPRGSALVPSPRRPIVWPSWPALWSISARR